jgi:ribosomal protein S12
VAAAVRKPNNCCFSRLGRAKARYHSLPEARQALERAERKRGAALEVYACEVEPNTWHLRKVRS